MEKYIQKIESRLNKKYSSEKVEKIIKRFLTVGGIVVVLGIIGILAAMICFSVFFVQGDTDTALTCWIIAVPFVVVLIAGAVVARVGDKMKKNIAADKDFSIAERRKKTQENENNEQ